MSSDSEPYRFQCEVRQLLMWGVSMPRGFVGGFLRAVESKRGKQARETLECSYREQWSFGNRGEPGDWRS